jgi:hypothetical protein
VNGWSSRKSTDRLYRWSEEAALPPGGFFFERTQPQQIGKKWNIRFLPTFSIRHHNKLEEETLKKILMIGALAFAATAVAESAVAAEFYVVRDATTKKCTIVDTKPTTTTTTIVDNGTFKTRTEAETGMKTMKVCTTN